MTTRTPAEIYPHPRGYKHLYEIFYSKQIGAGLIPRSWSCVTVCLRQRIRRSESERLLPLVKRMCTAASALVVFRNHGAMCTVKVAVLPWGKDKTFVKACFAAKSNRRQHSAAFCLLRRSRIRPQATTSTRALTKKRTRCFSNIWRSGKLPVM